MKKTYFTVGPSQIYPTVAKHLSQGLKNNIASISHRGRQYQEIHEDTVLDLKKLMNIPNNYSIFFLGSALEAMERILENCVHKSSFHFVNGAFAKKFYEFGLNLKKNPTKIEVADGTGFDFDKIKVPNIAELIAITHNETSTGVAIPVEEIYKLKDKYPDKLIALDIVSSVPYVDLDFRKLDLVFFSVQKGFGMPAGLGVLIVSSKAQDKSKALKEKGLNIGTFHSFPQLLKLSEKNQTPGTPNVLYIYLLGKVVKDFLIHGVGTIKEETEKKAKLIYDYFSKHKKYAPFVQNKRFWSQTTIVIDLKGDTEKVVEKLKKRGIIVGRGYGDYKNEHIRIANFPAHKLKDIQRLLSF